MIISKVRLQEEHPMLGSGSIQWPLPYCDLHVDSYAGSNGYICKNIFGLGPPEFLPVVQGFDIAGVSVYDSVPEKREIALRVGFQPTSGKDISELRSSLHRYISRSILVSFMHESDVIAQTKGYISKFESVHFSNEPEVQMTIVCGSGDLQAPNIISIPTAVIDVASPVIAYNEGDAPTGLDIVIKYASGTPAAGFTISNYGKFWYDGVAVDNQFIVTYSIINNDEITLKTHPNDRKLTLLRSGTTYDLAGYLNPGAVWPRLYPGVNTFTWNLNSLAFTWLSASYRPRFWGV